MREKFTCRSVTQNNGIRQVLLTFDPYRSHASQPTELLLNTQSDAFEVGDEWIVQMTLISRRD